MSENFFDCVKVGSTVEHMSSKSMSQDMWTFFVNSSYLTKVQVYESINKFFIKLESLV